MSDGGVIQYFLGKKTLFAHIAVGMQIMSITLFHFLKVAQCGMKKTINLYVLNATVKRQQKTIIKKSNTKLPLYSKSSDNFVIWVLSML